MTTTSLAHVELSTGPEPRGTVIWLHGLGADGWDFVPIVRELPLPEGLDLRFIFPHAPTRPVTINNGYVMRAWYDISMQDLARRPDEAGIRESQKAIENLVRRERERGVASDKIVLAGFSQGGAIALQTALRHAEELAGVIALSTYLPIDGLTATEREPANDKMPIFMGHGGYDPVVPQMLGTLSRDALVALGYDVEWHSYPMAHQVCPPEISDLRAWIAKRLAAAPA